MAHAAMQKERRGHTLQPTALLNEALAQLLAGEVLQDALDRGHFFSLIATAMRHVLLDYERRRHAAKRGKGQAQLALEALPVLVDDHNDFAMVDLLEALDALAAVHDRASQVVTLRLIAKLSISEVAKQLAISRSTAESDWRFARSWLRRHLADKSA